MGYGPKNHYFLTKLTTWAHFESNFVYTLQALRHLYDRLWFWVSATQSELVQCVCIIWATFTWLVIRYPDLIDCKVHVGKNCNHRGCPIGSFDIGTKCTNMPSLSIKNRVSFRPLRAENGAEINSCSSVVDLSGQGSRFALSKLVSIQLNLALLTLDSPL